MLEIENEGAGVNFYNNIARSTGNGMETFAASSEIVGRFCGREKIYEFKSITEPSATHCDSDSTLLFDMNCAIINLTSININNK